MPRVMRQPDLATASRSLATRAVEVDPEVIALLERARAEARAEGEAIGAQRTRIELQDDREARAQLLHRTVMEAVAAHRAAVAEHAQETVELALRIAQEIAAVVVDDNGAALADRIRAALASIDDDDLVVRVGEDRVDSVTTAFANERGVRVVVDATLGPDDAEIDGPWASADLTDATRWDIIREAVTRA